ncbi:aminomethyl-transferring glycine dehydrogenase [Anabaena cylindrica FACHB-243]|uniref:Glycine dehydrogenase (decarboxylating) n=1 Tax=Anabaena cylindrica (strain ATCC 27899 / PCC 7122) TaxID=272123 RepID=K9ZD04_ANACC|nr:MULTISPECIES: aminomethyl-transferring glycine dehydrogenase [Anabaena]AFZ56230.1 Glycine dehydrogenase (decarboxylating) [Anabaena cylindrica PCC 7122]MBD2417457.1 aminomethyl-transferring glycine dehydrogenase [Anabaena cylindrica FACHB-243]MBY5285787.1 aminomethyl-transferring glycine dehydrogenase [Anabaena sp. CCAP 1446/1C]MBY5311758.1 aminomethyl-transferring glycine dehydrogenase [Anabaena sp. CCAP 1446/1C]MCM2407626.1 aminomethyl-transferring glycine dehydrogenase [Anabaena sp. CCAP
MVANPPRTQPSDNKILAKSSQKLSNFAQRHIGINPDDIQQMLDILGFSSLDNLIDQTVPQAIRFNQTLQLPAAQSEYAALAKLKQIADKNQVYRSFIGMGYYDCITPAVIQRNILENPGWYTAYTPYQPEIAQGRLEALLNFQTMIIDLTGLEIANASLLDEATAAAEAMSMSYGVCKNKANNYFVSRECHPQTIDVLQTRAKPLGINIIIGDHQTFDFAEPIFGAILQYPASDGTIYDYLNVITQSHAQGALVTVAADPLSLTLLTPPGEFGADIAVGSTQRFGIPLGFGGPHAAYFATKEEYKRLVPGRIVGVSKDVNGKPALRLALQTREQHIRRDKATSNICTAQVLLAVMASMYAVYHGPDGLRGIAENIHQLTVTLANGLKQLGYKITSENFFDTLRVELGNTRLDAILDAANERNINLRIFDNATVGISLNETTTPEDLIDLWQIFALKDNLPFTVEELPITDYPLSRQSKYLTHPVFNQYHSETELLRYLHQLETKDLSLTTSMIPLGSCTMKLNATSEMIPVTWAEFGKIHPFAPISQTRGYQILFQQLEAWLAEITGFAGISLQPNAGSQGEYTGLLVIHEYHQNRGEGHRNICLIPQSAHGTNPASAVMCGMKVVGIACDDQGNIDVDDLKAKAEKYSHELAALMVTYPSTHGVFEEAIQDICAIVHNHGGQVYMDGANMNAQVGICRPGDIGADVCHLNLHKTFCIPHGGGGPGMGPIGVASHLVPFLPGHSVVKMGGELGAVSAAPWGSASILVISWMYIAMMGADGLTQATKVAILNANYIAKRLESYYPVLYQGKNGLVAHECILDLRSLKKSAHIEIDDVAKRLMDYGFHAPTVSWPVAGTIMVEPTESESKQELDRFCNALIAIREEVAAIESGKMDIQDNLLKNAPHTAESLIIGEWNHPYSREQAAYPAPWNKEYKFWPSVGRIDAAFGDRNFVCSCLPMEAYS